MKKCHYCCEIWKVVMKKCDAIVWNYHVFMKTNFCSELTDPTHFLTMWSQINTFFVSAMQSLDLLGIGDKAHPTSHWLLLWSSGSTLFFFVNELYSGLSAICVKFKLHLSWSIHLWPLWFVHVYNLARSFFVYSSTQWLHI